MTLFSINTDLSFVNLCKFFILVLLNHVEGNIGGYFPYREGAMQISTTFTDITRWIIIIIIIYLGAGESGGYFPHRVIF